MKRYITHTLLCLLVLLVACNNSGLGLLPEDGDGHIVLNFSAADSQTRLGDHATFESLVEHIDVFVTDNSKAEDAEGGIIHHERFTIGNSSNGRITLQGIRLSALIGKTIRIYAVANSTKEESALKVQSVKSLKEQIEVQPLVYLTGTGLAGGDMTAPHSFLMWGEGKVGGNTEIYIDNNVIGDLDVTLRLVRSVAKVEFHFLRETGKDSNGDSNGITPNIHGFGEPVYNDATPIDNIEAIDLNKTDYIANGSYYFNNLPFKTYFAPNDDINIPSEWLRKTTPIYNNGHFHYENPDDVKIVAYVYSYSWDAGVSEFESAPRMVVNLPAVVYNDGGRTTGTYLEDNFYEIQLRRPTNEHVEGDDKIYLRRNKHYIIKAKINAPGSKSAFEPIEIDQPIFFEERPWTDVNFDIGGNNGHAHATYLTLNTDLVEMRNVATDNKTLRFASSSPLQSITLQSATYIDKWGEEQDVTENLREDITCEYDKTALQGVITINSPLPSNDALRTMTFSVTNSDALTETFTVKQYPAITISNIRAWFSYREDFNSWYTNDGDHIGKAVWDDNNKKWSYPTNVDAIWVDNTVFVSKVSRFESGQWKIFPYYWVKVFSWWIKMDAQNWGSFGNNFASDLTNARIYHVTINATGAGAGAYTIGRPRMEETTILGNKTSITDDGPSNAQLISPSFMIASQLGESANMASFTKNYQQAAEEHCNQYVEVYEDENGQEVHLKGWRLPTAAEIQILLDRQGIANAAVDEVLPGAQYISASGVVNGKAGGKAGIYIRCIRDHYVPTANAMNE